MTLFLALKTQIYRCKKGTALSNGQLGVYRYVGKLIFLEHRVLHNLVKLTKLSALRVDFGFEVLVTRSKYLLLVYQARPGGHGLPTGQSYVVFGRSIFKRDYT